MKYFWLIFSFFLFTLSVYPCNETDDCEKNATKEIITTDSHKKQNPKTEHCTPFCTCSHCPASAFYINVPNFNLKKSAAFFQEKKLLSFYSFTYAQKITDTIWQPPKIS